MEFMPYAESAILTRTAKLRGICFRHHFARRRAQGFERTRHFARHGNVGEAENPAQALNNLGKRRVIARSENQALGDAFERCHGQVRHALADGVAQPAEKVVLVLAFQPDFMIVKNQNLLHATASRSEAATIGKACG